MPSVVRVREWYEQSFVEIRRSQNPVDVEKEKVNPNQDPRRIAPAAYIRVLSPEHDHRLSLHLHPEI